MKKIEIITLAALLHDIGKFSQIAGLKLNENESKYIKEICPQKKERSSHIHALYSADFIKEYFENSIGNLAELARYHHLPEKASQELQFFAKVISIADWLANGEFRGKEIEIEESISHQALVSIFSKITLGGKGTDNRYISSGTLKLNLENLFPQNTIEEAIQSTREPYQKLWELFTSELRRIDFSRDFKEYINQIIHLLEKYTITVPAISETTESFISLFHHLKTTAAIASCIWNLEQDKIEQAYEAFFDKDKSSKSLLETSCYLIGGDVSGIQDFIYSVTSEHALKGLRGRSFYLQLLSESVAKSILDRFDLTPINILYVGGGHFFMLLPMRSDTEEILNQMKKIIDHNLLKAHRGKLALAISWRTLAWQDFLENRFGNAFHDLKQKLALEKRKKFASYITVDGFKEIMGSFDVGGEQPVCEICSDELTSKEKEKAEKSGTLQCSFCQSFIELAGDLARNKLFEERKLETGLKLLDKDVKSYKDVIKHFGYEYNFRQEKEEGETTYIINSTEFLSIPERFDGFKFFPQYAPVRLSGAVKTLEDFSEISTGIKTWGVFRADVDRLGDIFKLGLEEKQTITNISMLSYFVSLFFSAHVEWIAKNEFEGKIYIIYSGGDDMFALGSWSVLPDFARQIQESFINFTGDNPAIKISGGIYISPSEKFPVYQAAASAGQSLEQAKIDGRNRLTFFEKSILWSDFRNVQEVSKQIVDLLKEEDGKKKVPRALLQMLSSGWAEKERTEKATKNKSYSIFRVWRILYAFKRFRERYRKHEEELVKLESKIITDHKLKPYLDVATRWAEYLTR